MKKTLIFLFIILIACMSDLHAQDIPAFPGAVGFGKYTKGARNAEVGKREVYHVTNLNDSGTGSFRDAVTNVPSGVGRIVVFDVAGIITLKSTLDIKSNLYIAGQTAPGEGIVIYENGNRVSMSGSDNIIIRNIRFRGPSGSKDALGLANGHSIVVDHVSVTWGTDETFSINSDGKGTEPRDITISNSIIGQGLLAHSCGGLMQTKGGITIYRCLWTDNKTRNPKVKGVNQFINNVVYNWGSGGGYILSESKEGEAWATIENNYFISGPVRRDGAFRGSYPVFNLYQRGNMLDNNRDGILNGVLVEEADFVNTQVENGVNVDYYPTFRASYAELEASGSPRTFPIIDEEDILSAEEAFYYIKDNAGATMLVRDMVDNYIMEELSSVGTEGIHLTTPVELKLPNVVGYVFTGYKEKDSDGDGIPDDWEIANGLNPNDASDAVLEAANGYLNIENYINSITGPIPYVKYPTEVQLYESGKTFLTLAWDNNEVDADKIIAEMSTDNFVNEDAIVVKELPVDATTCEFDELEPAVKYYFRLKTIKGELESVYTDTKNYTTLDDGFPRPSINPTPEDDAVTDTYRYVTLSWDNETGLFGGTVLHTVYMGTSENDLEAKNPGGGTQKNITLDVEPLTTYYWRVDTKNNRGEVSSEVWNFTTHSKPERDTVAYYSFDHSEGTVLQNLYGPDANAMAFDPEWVQGLVDIADDVIGMAVNFPGEGEARFVQEHYEDIALGEESFSLDFWFKSPGSSSADWYIINKGSFTNDASKGTTGKWFGIQYNTTGSNNRLTWAVDDDDDNQGRGKSDLNITPGDYFKDEWVHMVCVRDMETKQLRVYLNGKLAGSRDDISQNIGNEEDMVIGNCTNLNTPFKGLIDDLIIYRGALTEEEALERYLEEFPSRIEKNESDKQTVRVFPIPFENELTIVTGEDYNASVQVVITDMMGQIVLVENVECVAGTLTVGGLGNLAKGYYICNVKCGDTQINVKVVK